LVEIADALSTGVSDFWVILYLGPGKVDGIAGSVAALVFKELIRPRRYEAGLSGVLDCRGTIVEETNIS
jgi:hypothetical protein